MRRKKIEAERETEGGTRRDAKRKPSRSSGRSTRLGKLHRSAGNQAIQSLAENGGLNTRPNATRESTPRKGDEQGTGDPAGRPTHTTADGSERKPPVQASGRIVRTSPEAVRSVARRGTRGDGESLPHRRSLEGHVDSDTLSAISAHTSERAQRAAADLGAEAYTMGTDIAFRRDPDVNTVAHEVAHVVQQRDGEVPTGGVGSEGDQFERAADRFAENVTGGRDAGSPNPSVDRSTPDGSGSAGAVQFQKTADGTTKRELRNEGAKLKGGSVKGQSTFFDVSVPVTPALVVEGLGYKPETGQDRSVAESASPSGTVTYSEGKSEAFIGGIQPEDIDQGGLGTCYLLGAMAMVARERPGMIRDMISEVSGENAYEVTLNPVWFAGINSEETVTVTPEFPSNGGSTPAFTQPGQGASGSNETELWPMLIEKAYAKMTGSYSAISGGIETESVEVLGANFEEEFDPLDRSGSDVLSTIDSALDDEDKIVGCDTPSSARGIAKKNNLFQNRDPLDTGHAYSVRAVDTSAETIDVDNPHGSGSSEDITGMPVDEFQACFERVTIASLPSQTSSSEVDTEKILPSGGGYM